MEGILAEKGIILVGEAAKSWVNLQWFNSIMGWSIGGGFVLLVAIIMILWFWMEIRGDS